MDFIGITVESKTVENAGRKSISGVKSKYCNDLTLENRFAGNWISSVAKSFIISMLTPERYHLLRRRERFSGVPPRRTYEEQSMDSVTVIAAVTPLCFAAGWLGHDLLVLWRHRKAGR